jgi:hypothetical protein
MLRQEFYVKTYIPSSQILTLFTTPVTLVAAQGGIFYLPKSLHVSKEAGTAYTLNGALAIGVYHTSLAGTAIATKDPSGFMDQTGVLTFFTNAPNTLGTPFGSFTTAQVTNAIGAPLVFANSVANLTVGTGGIFVTVLYEQWPAIIAFS